MPLLNFDDNDMVVLNEALIAMPYVRVAGLIEKINQQLGGEQEPAAAAVARPIDDLTRVPTSSADLQRPG